MKYHPLPCRCPISTTYDAAVVATSAPVALDDLSRTPNNLISPLIERSSAISQTMVCEPVHVFRLVRKFFKHVRAPSQSQPDFLCLRECAIARRLLLALIRTPIAVAAREQAANIVQLGNPAACSALSNGVSCAYKPRPEPPRRPGKGNALLHTVPILAIRMAFVFQYHRMMPFASVKAAAVSA